MLYRYLINSFSVFREHTDKQTHRHADRRKTISRFAQQSWHADNDDDNDNNP